jgi:hypothetical protein
MDSGALVVEEKEFNYCGDVLTFLRGLSAHGFKVGLDHNLAIQRLLINLAARGALPDSPLKLTGLLAPIICGSPEEQRSFSFLFEEWAAEQSRFTEQGKKIKNANNGKSNASSEPHKVQMDKWPRRSPTWTWILWLISILFVLAVVFFFLIFFNKRDIQPNNSQRYRLQGKVFDEKGSPLINSIIKVSEDSGTSFLGWNAYSTPRMSTMVNGDGTYKISLDGFNFPINVTAEHSDCVSQTTKVNEPTITTPGNYNIFVGFVLVRSENSNIGSNLKTLTVIVASFLLGLIFLWLVLLARRLHLKRWRTANKLHIQHLAVKGANEQLTQILSLRRAAQNLRRHRLDVSEDLNVARTVEATIRSGSFMPVYGTKKSSPEYLILINRSGPEDQLARIEDETVHHLIRNGVYVDRYYFKKDPRLCWKEGQGSRSYALAELAATHPRHHLVIFDNGSAFFDPITGSPHDWLVQFYNWSERSILTSEFRAGEYIEKELSDLGFLVLPATGAGIAALGEVTGGSSWRNSAADNVKPLPQLLRARPARWLEDHPPSTKVLGKLRIELKDFLGEEGYYWLSACAVYPMLSWDLTLYLGHSLLERHQIDNTLLRLLRLPWFPHGSMPDWVREALLSDLTAKQEVEIRQTLEDLLKTSLLNPEGFVLPIARKRKLTESDIFKSPLGEVKRRAALWREKLFVRDYIISESKESLLRDHVFISFMYGIRRGRLALLLPKELGAVFTKSASVDTVDLAVRAFMTLVLMIPFAETIYSAYTEGSFIIFIMGTCFTAFMAFLYIYGERTMFAGVTQGSVAGIASEL